MVDLRTRYLGLDLRSPLVASASPLTGTLDGLRRLEAAGAPRWSCRRCSKNSLPWRPTRSGDCGRVGRTACRRRWPWTTTTPGRTATWPWSRRPRPPSIPVIASLNGVTPGAWVEHATLLEEAGADALELNIYYVSSRPGLSGGEVEWHYLELVRAVRQTIGIPLAVKLSPYFSSVRQPGPPAGRGRCRRAGAVQPLLPARPGPGDPGGQPSAGAVELEELRLPLRWIAILHSQVPASLAASTGVHTAADVVKVLLAGADVAMMTSALLRHGPEHLTAVEVGLRDWLDEHGTQTVGHLRGLRSQRSVRDPAAWERANYITMLAGYPDQVHTEAR